ncbi:MAG TPA: glycoside hydrolase family 3 protein, partial [Polyangiaceae bacterium]
GSSTGGSSTGGSSTGGAGGSREEATGGVADGDSGEAGRGGAQQPLGGEAGLAGVTGEAGSSGEAGQAGAGAGASVPPFLSQACIDKAASLVAMMTLAEKAAQMVEANDPSISAATLTNVGLGSVLADGGFSTGSGNAAAWAQHIATLHAAARASRLHIPLLYAVDSVHGMNHARDAIIFPHNIGLGASHDPDLVERVSAAAAIETAASGVDWTFAPVIAAARDERWGRTYESFSEDPQLVGLLGARAVLGFQGHTLGEKRESVLATAKHFAGDGATNYGSSPVNLLDRGNVTLSESEFRSLAVSQYVPAIKAGVGSIMVSFSSYQGVKMSNNSAWLTTVLKHELGFEGFLISDWDDVSTASVTTAVNAGLDMLMESTSWSATQQAIANGVTSGAIALERVDDAVTRILRVKCGLGLFERGEPDAALLSQVGSVEHRALAREAVQKSIVLLKNDQRVLPLSKALNKLVIAGSAANVLRKQMGGWTLDWQGSSGNSAVGTNLLTAVTSVLGSNKVEFQASPADPANADAVLLAIGEEPYAEWAGDTADLSLSAADSALIAHYASYDVPIVVVLFSGRPLIISNELGEVSAFIAAFLPGSAGEGIADILFGDASPSAQLSMSWPKSNAQIPINAGDPDYESDPPLFPLGFGLRY